MSLRHGVLASSQTQEQRVEELRLRLHHKVLQALLCKNPKCVNIHDIEGNRGRQGKAIRDLGNHVCRAIEKPKKESYYNSPGNTHWSETLDAYLPEYTKGAEAYGEALVRTHLDNLMDGTSDITVQDVGWIKIEDEKSVGTLAHAWANRESYLFMGEGKSKPDGNPRSWNKCAAPVWCIRKSLYAELPKYFLRNAAEIYTSVMYDTLAVKDAGLPGWSDNKELTVTLTNVGAFNPLPSTIEGVQKQCQLAIESIKTYMEACGKLGTSVERHGGEKEYRKDILVRAIRDMLTSAPILLVDESEERPSMRRYSHTYDTNVHPALQRMYNMKEIARYVLEHHDLMDYGKLFDDREGVWSKNDIGITEKDAFNVEKCTDNVLDKDFKMLLGIPQTKEDVI